MTDDVVAEVRVTGGVVVGDDGSPGSDGALEWAAAEAVRRGVTLHVLRAWNLTTAPRPQSWVPGYVCSLTDYQAAVQGALDERIADLATRWPRLSVVGHPVHDSPASALEGAAGDADLLVVGHHGERGGALRAWVLGSVAEHCVHHAAGPVVVVRPRRTTPVITP